MSFTSVALASAGQVPAAGDTFTGPSPGDFWQPMFGAGAWAFTRPMGVSLILTILLAVWLVAATRRAAAVPTLVVGAAALFMPGTGHRARRWNVK